MDKETNSIYNGLESIKYMNAEVSEKLYELRDQKFDSFLDLLDVFPGNSRQRELLIKLDFFSEFGKTSKLLKLCDLYDSYNNKKLLKKEKLNLPLDLVQKYAISETAKQYRFDKPSMDALLRELEKLIPDTEIPLRTKLEAQLEYCGYLSYIDPTLKNTGFITSLDTKYSPKISIYILDTGTTITAKLRKNMYQKQPFDVGNIIKFTTTSKPKSKMVNGTWEKDYSQMENWISTYEIIHTL